MLDDSVGQHEATARPQSFGRIDFRCNAYGCSGLLRGRVRSWLLPLLLTTAAGCFLAGCRTETSTVDLEMATAETKPPEQNHFEIAVDFLKMRDEHNLDRSASQSAYHLNRWIRDQAADPRWMIDRPLLNTLPDAIRRAPATKAILSDKALAQLEFRSGDVLLLEESRWLRAIAVTASQAPSNPDLSQWLSDTGLDRKAAKELATSQKLFDWTIRNIQLDELVPYPKKSAAGPITRAQRDDPTADWPPPMLGQPGPGYTGQPWHVLMYGHGDMYQRARVFILLVRQMRIDAVMLAIDTKTGRADPWLPAVRVENELYLFDSQLGIPIPGPGGKGIATLTQVQEDPAILESLNLGANYQYRVTSADLDKVVALIDATPEYLSQRMKLVEQQLSAADQMVLTLSPSDLKRALQDCQGIQDVRLWAVPIEANIYQQAYAELLSQNPEMRWKDFVEHGLFQYLTPIVKGRRQYLLGNLINQGDQKGATSHYLAVRIADAALEDLEQSKRLQASMGLERPRGMSDEDWLRRVEQVKRLQVEAKKHASYWIGVAHLEQGNYEIAANWFKTRTLENTPEGPWTNGARYNLARCYEALNKPAEARQLYMIDESPQRYGNLLRARSLPETADTQSEAPAAEVAPEIEATTTSSKPDASPDSDDKQ